MGLSRQEARRRARVRSAEYLEREKRFIELVTEWEITRERLAGIYAGMYELGMTRVEIASRLGVKRNEVPGTEGVEQHDP